MAHSGESRPGSEQRAQMGEGGLPAGLTEHALRQQVAAQEAELARTRAMVRERHQLLREAEQLREQLRRQAGELEQLRAQAADTGRRQNEFLAMLAHELRNPLAPLSMSASLLDSVAGASGELAQVSRVIRRQVDHMAHLLNDLLDAARLSSGKITLSLEPLLLSDAIEQALETVGPRLRERRQQIEVRLAPEALVVDGDAVRLTQVFTNLLSNASKYPQDGGWIRLAVECGDEVVVSIADNGSGMAPETIVHVFELFTQGPRTLARSEGGLGVGLNVVRNLVGMHGGSVGVSSPGIGAGSVFTVRLPLSRACAPTQAEAPSAPASGGGRRILVIEDNRDACEVLRMLLELEGHQVDVAADGHAGLALALACSYDAIVCDIGLPGIDGYELIARLRACSTGAAPLAVALSGYGHANDRERAIAAGFDRYLVKPVGPEALLEALGVTR